MAAAAALGLLSTRRTCFAVVPCCAVASNGTPRAACRFRSLTVRRMMAGNCAHQWASSPATAQDASKNQRHPVSDAAGPGAAHGGPMDEITVNVAAPAMASASPSWASCDCCFRHHLGHRFIMSQFMSGNFVDHSPARPHPRIPSHLQIRLRPAPCWPVRPELLPKGPPMAVPTIGAATLAICFRRVAFLQEVPEPPKNCSPSSSTLEGVFVFVSSSPSPSRLSDNIFRLRRAASPPRLDSPSISSSLSKLLLVFFFAFADQAADRRCRWRRASPRLPDSIRLRVSPSWNSLFQFQL